MDRIINLDTMLSDDDSVPVRLGTDTRLYGRQTDAFVAAIAQAAHNEAPVGVWARDGWWTVCDVPPDMIAPDPERLGWVLWQVVPPQRVRRES